MIKETLKRSLISFILFGGFLLLPGITYAQSGHFVFAQQSNLSTTIFTANAFGSVARTWDYKLGNGFTGTTTGAFTAFSVVVNTPGQWSRVDLDAFSDPSYTTNVAYCTWDSLSIPAGNYSATSSNPYNQDNHKFQEFNNGCTFNPNLYYDVVVSVVAAYPNFPTVIVQGNSNFPASNSSNTGYPAFPMFALVGDGFYITPTASTTGLFLSGAQEFCNGVFGTSTGGVFGIGTDLANGTCQAFGYLFVPTPASIQQFQNFIPTLESKIPFSYAFELQATYTSLSASSTENLPVFTIPFPDLSSSTPLGTIIPTQITFFSTTTISKYYPDYLREDFLQLGAFAIWIGLIVGLYRRITPHTTTEIV